MNEPNAVDVMEPDIEAGPESAGLVTTTQQGVEDTLFIADNIEKLIDAQNRIRAAVMKLAQPGDWVVFGANEKAKAEIGFAGAMRIASVLGVNFTNWEAKKEAGRDDIGEWFRWEFEADVSSRGRLVRVYGRASSRDKFLGKVGGEFRPVHEVDEGNIKMIARRAAMKEGVKVLFGLHHLDPAYIQKFGVKLESAAGYAFKSQEKQAEEMLSGTFAVETAKLQKEGTTNGKPWKWYQITTGDGKKFNTFSSTHFDTARQCQENKKHALISYKETEKGLVIQSIIVSDEAAL